MAADEKRDMVSDSEMREAGRRVASGEATFSGTLDGMVLRYIRSGGDPEQITAADERLGNRLERRAAAAFWELTIEVGRQQQSQQSGQQMREGEREEPTHRLR